LDEANEDGEEFGSHGRDDEGWIWDGPSLERLVHVLLGPGARTTNDTVRVHTHKYTESLSLGKTTEYPQRHPMYGVCV
jgi:hypothetical protein